MPPRQDGSDSRRTDLGWLLVILLAVFAIAPLTLPGFFETDSGFAPTFKAAQIAEMPRFGQAAGWVRGEGRLPYLLIQPLYHWTGSCSPPIAWCPPEWLVQLSPAITVDAPAFNAHSEYPFVLGMAVATRPGSMMIATSVLGDRDTADFSVNVDVDVDVDVSIDLNLGIDFFSIF